MCGAITAPSQARVLQKPGIPAETAGDETTPSEGLSDALLGLLSKIKCGRDQFILFKTTFSGRDGEPSQEPKLRLKQCVCLKIERQSLCLYSLVRVFSLLLHTDSLTN